MFWIIGQKTTMKKKITCFFEKLCCFFTIVNVTLKKGIKESFVSNKDVSLFIQKIKSFGNLMT